MSVRPIRHPKDIESDDAGVVAVEFALVLPLLVVLLFTIVIAGSVYIDQLQLQSVVRNAARIGSVAPSVACDRAIDELAGNHVGSIQCQLLEDCTDGNVKVRLVANQVVSIPLVGNRSVTLEATSSYSCGT
jgi:hypothetical protein